MKLYVFSSFVKIYYLTKFYDDWIRIDLSNQLFVCTVLPQGLKPPVADPLARYFKMSFHQMVCIKILVTGTKFHAKTSSLSEVITKIQTEGGEVRHSLAMTSLELLILISLEAFC